ncbi:hypothetical protein MY7_0532 [Bacillus sp. 5B6]|nr:hypothetical protein MY7_0532 [Bacillus sp. 5B6]
MIIASKKPAINNNKMATSRQVFGGIYGFHLSQYFDIFM